MEKKEYTFSDLRPRYSTGRSYVISGTGKDRVYGYRNGVVCSLGDIEKNEWETLSKECISQHAEQELFSWLVEFVAKTCPWLKTKAEREEEALNLHMRRLFDNDEWVCFVPFNRRYRPNVLKQTALQRIRCTCCQKPGEITKAIFDKRKSGGTLPCPICGRWAAFTALPPLRE